VNFGFRGVTAAALLPGRMRPLTDVARLSTVSSGMSYIEIAVGQSELGAAASRKAVWWDLRLASLLTHLLWPPYVIGGPLYFCPVVSYGRPM